MKTFRNFCLQKFLNVCKYLQIFPAHFGDDRRIFDSRHGMTNSSRYPSAKARAKMSKEIYKICERHRREWNLKGKYETQQIHNIVNFSYFSLINNVILGFSQKMPNFPAFPWQWLEIEFWNFLISLMLVTLNIIDHNIKCNIVFDVYIDLMFTRCYVVQNVSFWLKFLPPLKAQTVTQNRPLLRAII